MPAKRGRKQAGPAKNAKVEKPVRKPRKGRQAGKIKNAAKDGPTDSQAMGQPQAALLDANMAKARQVAPSTLQHTDDDANKENGVPVPQGPDPAEAQVLNDEAVDYPMDLPALKVPLQQHEEMVEPPSTDASLFRLAGMDLQQQAADFKSVQLKTTERRLEAAPRSALRLDTDDEGEPPQSRTVSQLLASMIKHQECPDLLHLQDQVQTGPKHPGIHKQKDAAKALLHHTTAQKSAGARLQEDDDIMAPLNFEATDRSLAHEQMHMSPTRHEKLALPRSAPKQGSRRRKLTDQQKAVAAVTLQSEAEEEPSLENIVAGMLQESPEESDEEGSAGAGLAELQRTMARVVAGQKQAARKKQLDILQRAQAAIDEDAAKLIESTEQEMACLQTLGQAELQKLAQQMASKMAFIKKLQDECQQETLRQWEQCQAIYGQSKPLIIQLQAAAEKQQAQKKRKLAEFQARSEDVMKQAENDIARSSRKAQKLPSIAKLLATFV
ncbi:hypothetical protein WJX84_010668 [Apatococcus fuscideae]|uniref:Uncharacterized protein n=1 Tax=Apatococcus fuscideae TaxID=2026836 RepID=A0AAW1S9Q4_9CHLO